MILCRHSTLCWHSCYMLYDIQFNISLWWIYSGPNRLSFCLPSLNYKPFVSSSKVFWYLTLIHAWLYLTYVILDGACLSISSWHILLKCSHRLLILVLMALNFNKSFYCIKYIWFDYVCFFQKIDFMLDGSLVFGINHRFYAYYRWSRLLVSMLLLSDGLLFS